MKKSSAKTAEGSLEHNLLLCVYDLSAHISALWRHAFGEEITIPQYLFMQSIAQNPMKSQLVVCRHIHMDRTTASNVMKILVDKGWVLAHVNPEDRRERKLELTATGLRNLKHLEETRVKIEAALHELKPEGYKTATQWLAGVRNARIENEKAEAEAQRADI